MRSRIGPYSSLSACADDIAAILVNLRQFIRKVGSAFDLFEGLVLGIDKCVTIPLYQYYVDEIRETISERFSKWVVMRIADAATYLV